MVRSKVRGRSDLWGHQRDMAGHRRGLFPVGSIVRHRGLRLPQPRPEKAMARPELSRISRLGCQMRRRTLRPQAHSVAQGATSPASSIAGIRERLGGRSRNTCAMALALHARLRVGWARPEGSDHDCCRQLGTSTVRAPRRSCNGSTWGILPADQRRMSSSRS